MSLKDRKQPCTCLGSCKGPEGLGEGWVCSLTLSARESDQSHADKPRDSEIIAAFSNGRGPADHIPTHQPHAPLLTNEQIIWVVRRFLAGARSVATKSDIRCPVCGWVCEEADREES